MKAANERGRRSRAGDRVTRRRFLQATAAAAAVTATSSTWAAPAILKPSRPNILFINSDQQGLDTLSAYGCPGVSTPNYKYIAYRDDPTDQLFDMKNDPWETKNLAAEPDRASIAADHRKLLSDWEAPFDVAPIRQPIRPGRTPARKPSKSG